MNYGNSHLNVLVIDNLPELLLNLTTKVKDLKKIVRYKLYGLNKSISRITTDQCD